MLMTAATPIKRRTSAVTRVNDKGKMVSPWMSPSSRIYFSQVAQPQHELHVVDDADNEHHDAKPHQREAEVSRRGGLGDDILIAQLLKHLRNGEAEANQRQRSADHRHQRPVGAHARALKRHARAARRELGVRVQLEIGARHRPLRDLTAQLDAGRATQ